MLIESGRRLRSASSSSIRYHGHRHVTQLSMTSRSWVCARWEVPAFCRTLGRGQRVVGLTHSRRPHRVGHRMVKHALFESLFEDPLLYACSVPMTSD